MGDPTFTRLNVHATEWAPFPEFDGTESVLYTSPDGRRFAASFRLSGTHSWVMQYDDYFFVIAGSARVTMDGGDPVEIAAGDFCRIRQGTSVTFEMSDDFHEVSVLVSDTAFNHDEHHT